MVGGNVRCSIISVDASQTFGLSAWRDLIAASHNTKIEWVRFKILIVYIKRVKLIFRLSVDNFGLFVLKLQAHDVFCKIGKDSTSSNWVIKSIWQTFHKSLVDKIFAVKVIRIKIEWPKALLPSFVWYKEHRSSPLGWIARSRCSWWAGTKTNEVTLSAVSEPRLWAIFDLTRPCLRFPHCKTPWV